MFSLSKGRQPAPQDPRTASRGVYASANGRGPNAAKAAPSYRNAPSKSGSTRPQHRQHNVSHPATSRLLERGGAQ